MRLLKSYQTQNRCYIQGKPATPVGILVHSTGAVNKECRRYVDYPEELGKNQYNNHWNKASANKCMHGFLGLDKNGEVCFVNTLPYSSACWGCGKAKNGSYNYNPVAHIQFEICQGSNTDTDYYRKAIAGAEDVCVKLCREYGWTAKNIVSHKEGHAAGYASNHGDPESWMRHFGDDMAAFRKRVQAKLTGAQTPAVAPGEKVGEIPAQEGKAPDVSPVGGTGGGKAVVVTLTTLRQYATGKQVSTLQHLLQALGYLPATKVNGIFDTGTVAAVKSFQKEHDLTVDGIVGKNTWTALLA